MGLRRANGRTRAPSSWRGASSGSTLDEREYDADTLLAVHRGLMRLAAARGDRARAAQRARALPACVMRWRTARC
jgi:hypothetical protein